MPERARLWPPWATAALVATEAAKARLHQWAAHRGGLDEPDDEAARLQLAADIHMAADPALRDLAFATFAKIPRPVLDHLVRNASVVLAGVGVAGWCVPTRQRAEQTEGRQILVATFAPAHVPSAISSAEEFQAVLAHEAAHSWTEPPVPLDAAPVTRQERDDQTDAGLRLQALAVEWRMTEKLVEPEEEAERVAGALARSWGFRGQAADGSSCARARRNAVLASAVKVHAEQWTRLMGDDDPTGRPS
jgi:hypothetical protein